ncbi:MAG: 1-acyl-sn-glycerol-3-phosphate acyltransferase [Gammaproteobacteria bacterium]|nr:1-acyl-sn-glycerol-3-phosphate acyltransferase [Gammaproteobacteria bacterium]
MVNPLYRLWLAIRSTLFWTFFLPFVLLCATLLSLSFFTPLWFRMGLIKVWIVCSLASLHLFCGLKYTVEGKENIPENGFIVMSKHSSTWETIAIQLFFRPMVWVVKRELTWIPFFGWALKAVNAIALDRGTGRKAITQLIKESQRHMDQGRILMLFPEGTRVLPKQVKPFKLGGAIVSQRTGYAVVPIAHNAGEFWPRHSWIKWPGTIRVVIGPPIEPSDKKPEEIIAEVGDWISSECERISDKKQLQRIGVLPLSAQE